ncbi:MAG: pilin [Nanoarchaeota archaeon]|nr:pilin [Nanoarchaeota archaeon]
MKIYFSRILLLSILSFSLLIAYSASFAKDLSVDYPDIPGIDTPTTSGTPLSVFLNYAYSFAIFIGAGLAFILLIWAGIKYITSKGNPDKLTDARQQITASIIGLTIILGSYMILNTINPQLVELNFPAISINAPGIDIPSQINTSPIKIQEIPVGTLITSEITLSSFMVTRETDPRIDIVDPDDEPIYNHYFESEATKYPTDYQGGLEGRRLKRIHEVASTTLPAVTFFKEIYGDFLSATEELVDAIDDLYNLTLECTCNNCDRGSCTPNGGCICNCVCTGPICPDIGAIDSLLDSIPDYYKDPDSLVQCKLAHLEYYARGFDAFLEGSSNLVKTDNSDYEDNSYWHSDEAEELRAQIEECINQGMIEQDQYDDGDIDNNHWSTEELIDLMANVENKGTYTPKTDPAERDIETNMAHLQANIIFLEGSKTVLNPEHPAGCFPQAYSFLQIPQIVDSLGFSLDDFYSVPLGDVRVIEDPATFYCPLAPIDPNRETMLLDYIPQETSCEPIVEIPIGNTIDESLKLMNNIFDEIKKIYDKGKEMVDKALSVTDKEKGLAKEMFDRIGDYLSLVESLKSLNCSSSCYSECNTHNYTDADGKPHCICSCSSCQPLGDFSQLKQEISSMRGEIKQLQIKMQIIYNKIEANETSIYDSFYKLNSEYPDIDPLHPSGHPEAGERVPIEKDICCEGPGGYCRDPDTNELIMADGMAEEREYTLEEKLLQIQKLLNRSRDFGTYKILLDQLIGLGLADAEELTNLYETTDILLDLSNCDVLIAQIAEQTESGHSQKLLEGCWLAKSENLNHLDSKICSIDPPYDCDYFNPLVRERKSELLCYCFEHAFYPTIANNFFCCNIKN